MPRSMASDLGLYGLPMCHEKDARRIWVKHLNLFKKRLNREIKMIEIRASTVKLILI